MHLKNLCEGGVHSLKYLKKGQNRTEGRGHKDFKKGGKLGQGVGALKRRDWNPLTNYGYASKYLMLKRALADTQVSLFILKKIWCKCMRYMGLLKLSGTGQRRFLTFWGPFSLVDLTHCPFNSMTGISLDIQLG